MEWMALIRSVLFVRRSQFCRSTHGSAGLIFGLALLPLLLTAGAALDYQSAVAMKRRLQASTDAAVIAIAQQSGLTQSQRLQLAKSIVNANLGAAASRINPTISESEASNSYNVSASASVPASMTRLVHINSIAVSASATATATTTTGAPVPVCILALAKTGAQTFLANSGATIHASGCEVDVASTSSAAAMLNAGVNFTLNNFCVAGGVANNGATITDGTSSVLKSGCSVASDPFASTMPAVTVGACTVSNQNYTGAVSLSPGVYCGGFNFNGTGTLTLAPGLYIFSGATFNLNSGWTMQGSDVTLYFADSSYIQFNGTAQASLSAPTSGTYANILMFEKPGLAASSFTINGSGATPNCLSGLVYLPSRNITLNSGASANAATMTLVVNSLIMNGVTWNITPAPLTVASATASVTATTSGLPNTARLVR